MSLPISIKTALALAQKTNPGSEPALDRVDAQCLMLHALGKTQHDRAWLLTHDDEWLCGPVLEQFEQLCQRRAGGEPLAYIVGYRDFFGLTLQVDPRVLVPRPDTETLVDWSLEVLAGLKAGATAANRPFTPDILDLGTGSGAIAIALARTLQKSGQLATITATDASSGALAVAAHNARQLALDIGFAQSNWLSLVTGKYHLIASNPPYIAEADPHLQALRHEPLSALTAGVDGLDDLREIVKTAPGHLHQGAWLLLEHGYDQAENVRELLQRAGFGQIESRKDLAGIDRCSGGRWPS